MPARSPALAALLSFVFPGLGQAYAGHPLRGLLFALPMLLVVFGVLFLLADGVSDLLGMLLREEVLPALLVGNIALFIYRVAAIIDAYLIAGQESMPRSRAALPVAALGLLLLATAALHGIPEYYGYRAALGMGTVFHAGDASEDWTLPEPGWETPAPPPTGTPTGSERPTPAAGSGQPSTPSPAAAPAATPLAGPEWARDGRLNIVLLGSDEGPGRWSLRTDAIFLLSIEAETGRAALFGFPRYMSNIPLPPESAQHYPDGRFPGYLNAVYREAQDRPKRFPGNDARGLRVVAGAVQELAGVRVDDYAMVNLNGFVDVIDAMGGLWIDIPEAVRDPRYTVETAKRRVPMRFLPGCRLLSGREALAYARTRRQDNDYARMERQERTLTAMRRQFEPLAVLPRLPELFDAAGENLFWTIDRDDVLPMAQLAAKVDADRLQRVLFTPPEYDRELPDETVERIRAKVRGIFDEPEPPAPSRRPDEERCPPRG